MVINVGEDNVSQEFWLKNREINSYFINEVDQIELMSNKYKKVCTNLNYIKHLS